MAKKRQNKGVKVVYLILAFFVTLGGIYAYKVSQPEPSDVTETQVTYELLAPRDFWNKYTQYREQYGEERVVLLDVRTPQEFSQGHLQGATNMDFYSPTFKDRLAQLDRDKYYFVYCRSGSRSAKVVAMMKELGFKNVYELKGGILNWQAEGLPLTVE